MQRRSVISSTDPEREASYCLDVGLTKPEDEQLFYTASVHFLRKRLEERSHKSDARESTQSCCDLSGPSASTNNYSLDDKKITGCSSKIGKVSSLSMHQVLPFPKSSRDSYFARLKNIFRKYRRFVTDVSEPKKEEPETKFTSNFKLPRCTRLIHIRSSNLFEISEERSDEHVNISNEEQEQNSTSKTLEERKSVTVFKE